MKLTFLSAAVPLTKTISYSQRDDVYTTAPYPMVKKVTSHIVGVKDMFQFAKAILEQGALGRCLLFGELDRPLKDESRAGHAIKNEHDWICFDFDKVDCPPTMEGALAAVSKYLPEACARAEMVIQLSPSCFSPQAEKLSCHVFVPLAAPIDSETLKQWLIYLNFNGPLKDEMKLTDSGHTLSFALDRCVTDSSRLLYIAPPKTVGFTAALTNQDAVRHFSGAPLTIPNFTPIDRNTMNNKINDLREENMMDRREFKTSVYQGMEFLSEPGEGVIHDVRQSGDGHIRFNLNGGNSLAYWINLRAPHIIGNFKGEPYMYTREVSEKFFKGLTQSIQASPVAMNTTVGQDVLAFYATNRGSAIYIGVYDRVNDDLRIEPSSEAGATSWLKQYGMPMKASLPHYDLAYDVASDVRFEEGYPVINLYQRTDFIKDYAGKDKTLSLEECRKQMQSAVPTIFKIMASITGDARSHMALVNWLAWIFQNRKKAGTAWLLHGVPGTGKGLFIDKICKPLFGANNVGQILMTNVDSKFNSLLTNKLIVNIDEAAMTRSRDKVEAMSKLKNWITEPTMVINQKNQVEREEPSYCSFIITSNDLKPISIEEGDRRIHVGTRQEIKIQLLPNEIAKLEQGEELPALAEILGTLIVDESWVRNPDVTDQKNQLFDNTHTLLDMVGVALKNGDSTFFYEARPSSITMQSSANNALLPIKQFDDLLRGMADGSLTVLGDDDLYVLFHTTVHDPRSFSENQTEQKRVYKRYGFYNKGTHRCKRRGKPVYGFKAPEWQPVQPEVLAQFNEAHPVLDESSVVPIRGKKK